MYTWSRKSHRLTLCLLTGVICAVICGCEPSKPIKIPQTVMDNIAQKSSSLDFDTYEGFRDWYRIPLRYPYQIFMIDSLSDGYLEQLEKGSNVQDGSGSSICHDITRLWPQKDFCCFYVSKDSTEDYAGKYGYFAYSTGELKFFPNETALMEELKKVGITGPAEFYTLDVLFKYFSHMH
ncbi:MAG: hypothetical protein AB7F40_04615 [Victivallaceae bacterium]|nr:hypothetical protein [Victivallaceae bacterium]